MDLLVGSQAMCAITGATTRCFCTQRDRLQRALILLCLGKTLSLREGMALTFCFVGYKSAKLPCVLFDQQPAAREAGHYCLLFGHIIK